MDRNNQIRNEILKDMLLSYIKRFSRLIFGLFLYAVGIYCEVQANVGLAPWDAFNQGGYMMTGISMGNFSIIISLLIVGIDYFMGEKIGFGTILNAVFIGIVLDWLMIWNLIPVMTNFPSGLALQLVGLGIIGVASYFYIGAGMGCGPRDGLMVALSKRFPNTPVGVVRSCLEGTVLIVGWLSGGTIGVGTVVAVFGLGVIIQTTFRLFRFDVKGIQHENIFDTVRNWRKIA